MQNLTDLGVLKNISQINKSTFAQVTSYFGIIIIGLGLVFNTLTFLIFRLDKDLKKMPSIVILSFVCISDTLSLFTWNLNHFLEKYNLKIENIDISTCKIFSFMQYTSLEISGLLLSLCTIDRYFTVASIPGNFISKLPFGTHKTSLIWSISIISFIYLLNSYLLFADRLVNNDNIFRCYDLANGFKIYETWEKIHLFLYNFFPFVIMTIFNLLLIKKTRFSKKISPGIEAHKNYSKQSNKKNLTYSLLLISTSFLIMTLPSAIAFGLMIEFYKESNQTAKSIFNLLDYISFLNHTSLFFNCFLTNLKFRNFMIDFFRLIKCKFL